jgi:hypothetical protein
VNVPGVEVDVSVPSNLVASQELAEQAVHMRLRIGVQKKAARACRGLGFSALYRLRRRAVTRGEGLPFLGSINPPSF